MSVLGLLLHHRRLKIKVELELRRTYCQVLCCFTVILGPQKAQW